MNCTWLPANWAGLAVGSTIALSGCAGFGDTHEERPSLNNIYPDNYKSDLLAALHSYVADPTRIRDAYVSDPAIRPIGPRKRYVACVRFNAKNGDGRYVGSRDVLAIFLAGRFDQFLDQTNQNSQSGDPDPVKEECGKADYKRFPELEAMAR